MGALGKPAIFANFVESDYTLRILKVKAAKETLRDNFLGLILWTVNPNSSRVENKTK